MSGSLEHSYHHLVINLRQRHPKEDYPCLPRSLGFWRLWSRAVLSPTTSRLHLQERERETSILVNAPLWGAFHFFKLSFIPSNEFPSLSSVLNQLHFSSQHLPFPEIKASLSVLSTTSQTLWEQVSWVFSMKHPTTVLLTILKLHLRVLIVYFFT